MHATRHNTPPPPILPNPLPLYASPKRNETPRTMARVDEVAFRCLGVVHPVTHAVGNTFKRVFLIATSIIVFKSKLTPLAAVGSFMAIAGVLLYSLAKEWTTKNAAIKAQASK